MGLLKHKITGEKGRGIYNGTLVKGEVYYVYSIPNNPDDKETKYEYDSLEALCSEWEDWKDTPIFYVNHLGEIVLVNESEISNTDKKKMQAIGNWFNSEVVASIDLSILEAFVRLVGMGFEFKGWRIDKNNVVIDTNIKSDELNNPYNEDDLEQVFMDPKSF